MKRLTPMAMAVTALASTVCTAASPSPASLDLASLAKLGTVDERFQSYNIEMAEVTGGRFWTPYGAASREMFSPRPPIDLTDPRLIALARQLGPAYVRVSGSWANGAYLPAEGENPSQPPEGFERVVTRQQWRNLVAFSKASNAAIVTSFAVSGGTRGADRVWKPELAQRLVDLTHEAGGRIAAAEFFNEPNVSAGSMGMPEDYDAQDYAAEFRIFRDWARKAEPGITIMGPGALGEGGLAKDVPAAAFGGSRFSSESMLQGNAGSLDAVSYHFYGAVSARCEILKRRMAVKAEALTPEWLDLTLRDYAFYAALRDKYEPGKPIWNTETAQAACGGSDWAPTFLDSFRYLNQLGILAQQGVQVVAHNTLATSDYALIDRDTMTPRPNYWSAVLWKRTMGRTVLASPASPSANLRLYAHCLPGGKGGVGVTALNIGGTAQTVAAGRGAKAWILTGQPIDTRAIKVNGLTPSIGARGNVVGLEGAAASRAVTVPARSIAFLAVPGAGNPACR